MSSKQPEPEPAPQKELTGRIGKYEILRPVGRGAMGMVYLAHDTILERDVALKVMVAQIASDPELKGRFEREAKAVAKMTHPNVVMVFDLGYHTDGSPFIAMELLKGEDLHKAMRGAMTLDRKLVITAQVLAGLSHAHKAGIVHRDIKPANIFLNEDGSSKIMDFGVARLQSSSMTGTGHIVGTADYMSPEQVKGLHVDGRSDVFSVGCVLYELLTGARPFHSENLMTIFYKITHEEPDYERIPRDAKDLVPILQKALNKDLEGRYQTAYAFAVAVKDYLSTHTSSTLGRQAMDAVGDIEPPSSPHAVAITEPGGDATLMEEGPGEGTTAIPGARTTLRGGTVAGRAAGPTVLAKGTTVAAGRRPVRRLEERPTAIAGRPAPEPGRGPYLAIGAAVLVLAVGGAGYYFLRPQPAPPPQVTLAPTPTLALPTSTPSLAPTPVPSVAPSAPPAGPSTHATAVAALAQGEKLLLKGDYDRAETEAQRAISDDQSRDRAQHIISDARQGQKAAGHLNEAAAALDQGDVSRAKQEIELARNFAPTDPRIPGLMDRANRPRPVAPTPAPLTVPSNTARINELMKQANDFMNQSNFDGAIKSYDKVLELDPSNNGAILGKTQLLRLAQGQPGPNVSGHSFVAGRTLATAPESVSSGPEGFSDSAGVKPKIASEAAQLPGKIRFEVSPKEPKAGDAYSVKISFVNEGAAPITLVDKGLKLTTTINGKSSKSPPLTPLVRTAAPHETAVVWEIKDNWSSDTLNWVIEAQLTTTNKETYKSQIVWK